jgi:hypothetical protein
VTNNPGQLTSAAQHQHEPDALRYRSARGLCRPLGRGLSIWRAALDASTVSRFIGVSRFVPCSFGALFHRGGFSAAEREALKPPILFMRARTPRAGGKDLP